jgi:hypothetical protein
MRVTITLCAAVLAGASLVACGDDAPPATTDTVETTTPSVDTTVPSDDTTSTENGMPGGDESSGLWPAGGADTPEAAAEAFVRDVFGVEPLLGEFRAGDDNSGEIEVVGPEATGVRATVLVRRMGAAGAWYVIGAASAGLEFTTPATGAIFLPGPVGVEGVGRGFEGTIVVSALRTDGTGTVLDEQIGAGGAMGELMPFSVTLDLSAAEMGETLMLLGRGDTGLAGDTGEFTAISITIG